MSPRRALAGAVAAVLGGTASLLVSGASGVCDALVLGVYGLIWASLSVLVVLPLRGLEAGEAYPLLLVALSGVVVMDAFTSGYGVGSGLREAGPLARFFAGSPLGLMMYFVGVELPLLATVMGLVLFYARSRGLYGLWLSLVVAGLGPAVASMCNFRLAG